MTPTGHSDTLHSLRAVAHVHIAVRHATPAWCISADVIWTCPDLLTPSFVMVPQYLEAKQARM